MKRFLSLLLLLITMTIATAQTRQYAATQFCYKEATSLEYSEWTKIEPILVKINFDKKTVMIFENITQLYRYDAYLYKELEGVYRYTFINCKDQDNKNIGLQIWKVDTPNTYTMWVEYRNVRYGYVIEKLE